jgi:hypothetical protein
VKVDRALEQLAAAEAELGAELRTVGERHAADHDVYHLGHTLAGQSAERLGSLRPHAERYGARVPPAADGDGARPGIVEAVRHEASGLSGRDASSGMALLHDLRRLALVAQAAELEWVVMVQVAKAARDRALLDTASSGHEQAQTCVKWVRTRIKVTCPQVYVAG